MYFEPSNALSTIQLPCLLVMHFILIGFFYFRMTIATRGQTVGLDSTDNQTNVQVRTYFYFYYSSFNIYVSVKV